MTRFFTKSAAPTATSNLRLETILMCRAKISAAPQRVSREFRKPDAKHQMPKHLQCRHAWQAHGVAEVAHEEGWDWGRYSRLEL